MVNNNLPRTLFEQINDRIAVLKIKRLVLIGCYLPVDSPENEYEYGLNIKTIEDIYMKYENNYDVLILGYLNTDFKRIRSKNTKILNKFINKKKLKILDLETEQSFNFTYKNF